MPGLDPPLKWAGSKRWLVQDSAFLDFMDHQKPKRFVELFCGSAAVSLGLGKSKAHLNDVNRHVINFLRHLSKGLTIEGIETESSRPIFEKNRAEFNRLIATGSDRSAHAARLFYYLNRTCYNGLCRFNNSGEFNTPWGKYTNPLIETDLTRYRDVMANYSFSTGSFERVKLSAGDVVYADPPYVGRFTDYSKGQFGWDLQVKLALWLSEQKVPVVASNHWHPVLADLYQKLGFQTKRRSIARTISCDGDRTPAIEMLAFRTPP